MMKAEIHAFATAMEAYYAQTNNSYVGATVRALAPYGFVPKQSVKAEIVELTAEGYRLKVTAAGGTVPGWELNSETGKLIAASDQSDRRTQLSPVVTPKEVPALGKDEETLLARLRSGVKEDARAAARDLGLIASAKGLALLIAGDDDYAIQQFGIGMSMSAARRATLPPDIESLLVAHFERLGTPLVDHVIDGSRYQSQELLQLMRAEVGKVREGWKRDELVPKSHETLAAFVKTDLPIGDEVLAVAREAPADATHRSSGCILVGYFRKRPQAAAVPAIAQVLRDSREESTAGCIAQVLASMATAESIGAVVAESERVKTTDPKLGQRMLAVVIQELWVTRADVRLDLTPLRRALPPPSEAPDLAQNFLGLVRKRKDVASIPWLVTSASAPNVSDSLQSALVTTLVEVGAPDDWRKTLDDVEREFAAGHVSASRRHLTRTALGSKLDPEGSRDQAHTRVKAATEAGLSADARFLENAIAEGDEASVRQFADALRSQDRQHLPAEVEALIVRHFDHPRLSGTVQGMIGRSAYRTRELFALFTQRLRRGSTDETVRRMLTTDLPIEGDLLELLKGPSLYRGACEIAKFLGERRHAPAFAFLKHALEVGRQPETYNAGCPKEALLAFATPEAREVVDRTPDRWSADVQAPRAEEALRKLESVPLTTPIDFAEVRRAVGTPIAGAVADDYARFVQRRTPPEAVADMLALLSERASGAELYEPAFRALVAYDSPDVWKRAREEIERLHKASRIGGSSYDNARETLDALLADPEKALAKRRLERPHAAGKELSQWDEPLLVAELAKAQGQSARDVAEVLGARASEKGLEALIARGDASLFYPFAQSLGKSEGTLTPRMETLIYEHLEDARLANGVRTLLAFTRYRDRRIFDRLARQIAKAELKPIERATIASSLVRTELPVEADVLALLDDLPKGRAEMMARCPMIRFLGERHYAAAVKPLAGELQFADPEMSRCIASALNAIGTGEALRAVMDRVATLRTDPATAHVGKWIEDEALHTVKDVPSDAPRAFLEAKRAKEAPATPIPLRTLGKPGESPWEIVKALEGDPAASADGVESRLDAVGSASRDGESQDRLFEAYLRLASVVRFTLRNPKRAIAIYEKARKFARPEKVGLISVDLALADVHQFELRAPAEAVRHLRSVLDATTKAGGKWTSRDAAAMTTPFAAWLREEIRYLETGKPFSGTLSPEMVGGTLLFGAMFFQHLGADPRSGPLKDVSQTVDGRRPGGVSRERVAKTVAELPPSHAIFFQMVAALHLLNEEEVLAYLERQDPGRYLAAVVVAAGAMEDHALELGRHVGRSLLLPSPEPGTRYTPSSLRLAAERFTKKTGIRIEAPPFVREQATTQDEVDAVVQSTWKRLKDALRKGDVEGALAMVAVSKRDRYRPIFAELKDKQTDIDEVLTDIHKVEIRDAHAEYEMLRGEEGGEHSYSVEFVRDADGIWRLRSM